MIQRFFRKKYKGIISADIALSPLSILAFGAVVTVFMIIIYTGLSYLFFSEVIIKGARLGSVNPDTAAVRSAIFNGVTRVLPESKGGVTLIAPSNIQINPNDGDFVTVEATYTVFPPGGEFYEAMGGNVTDLLIPIRAVFSFWREYD